MTKGYSLSEIPKPNVAGEPHAYSAKPQLTTNQTNLLRVAKCAFSNAKAKHYDVSACEHSPGEFTS